MTLAEAMHVARQHSAVNALGCYVAMVHAAEGPDALSEWPPRPGSPPPNMPPAFHRRASAAATRR